MTPTMASPLEAFPQLDTGTHGGRIVQLLAGTEGRLFSTGETTVRVWDVATRRLQRLLLGRVNGATDDGALDGRVDRIAASPDGRWLLALKPWRHRPRRQAALPAFPTTGYGQQTAQAVRADRMADDDVGHDAGWATEVQVFEVATGNLRSRFLYPGQLLDADFSPDGQRVAFVANQRQGRGRRAEVLLLAARDLLRPGARESPAPRARLAVGPVRRGSLPPAALRFVPGQNTLVVAVGDPEAGRGLLAWVGTRPRGLALAREEHVADLVGALTLAVGPAMAAVGVAPARGRGLRGRLLWFRHDGSGGGTLDTEAPPAAAAFSPSGHRLAVGLMVDPDGADDAAPGTQVVQVNAYDVPAAGAPALRSTYFGHDDTVAAVAFVGEDCVASAGGDNRAIHFWSPAHRLGEAQGAIRGVGRLVFAPGITADERVLFGSVPPRQLPPGHAPRQLSFDLRRRVLATTAASGLRRRDVASRKWLVGDVQDVVIPLWFIGDGGGPPGPDRAADLTLFVGADDEWVLWTASGYYDASPQGAGRIGYRVNRGVAQEALLVPSDRFKVFYRPDIVAAVVQHGSEARARERGVAIAPVDVARMLPPIVELASLHVHGDGRSAGFAFTLESPCPEFPPTRLFLQRNGRVVWGEPKPPKRARARCTVPPLPLLPGPNRFSLHAENAQAKAVPLEFELAGPEATAADAPLADAPGRLFLLSVGVSVFADERLKALRFPARDAQAVADAIGHGRFAAADPRAPTRNLAFEDADIRTLVDTHATKAAILAELDRMCGEIAERHRRSGRERDVLFVFLSGHGMRVFDQDVPSLFFVNHDLVPTKDAVDATGLALLDLGDRITAVPAEVVLVVDACHSSLAGSGVAAGLDAEELARRVHALYERGMYVVSAARAEELAHEDGTHGFGVLTAALMEALQSLQPRDGRSLEVLMADLVAGVQRQVPVVSARAGTAPQTPVCRIYGDLMPLTILKT